MHYSIKWMTPAAFAFALSACGGSGGGSDPAPETNSADTTTETSSQEAQSETPTAQAPVQAGNSTEAGITNTQWLSDCFLVEYGDFDSGGDAYQQSHLKFSANSVEIIVSVYDVNDSSCTGTVNSSFSARYNFTLGEETTTDSGMSAYPLDKTLTYQSGDDYWEEVSYDIIARNGNMLYVGDYDTGWGESPETRPTDLDYSFYFTLID